MKRKIQLVRNALAISVLLALVIVGTALAITITIDGTEEVAWSGSGSQTPGTSTDGGEALVPDNADIDYVKWTNGPTDFYFLIRTMATPPRLNNVSWVLICLDTDNNTSTGSGTGHLFYNNCNSQTGFEKFIRLYSSPPYSVSVWDDDGFDGINFVGSGTYARATVIEMSVPMTLLFSGTTCPSAINAVFYYDGGDTSPDDNTPNSGTTTISCGEPTAITLTSVKAASNPPGLITPEHVGLLAIATVLVAGAGLVLFRRRKA